MTFLLRNIHRTLSRRTLSTMAHQDYVRTAGCLIIGDEVLNSKITDTNSKFLSKLLFETGIDLRRIEVIPDDEEDIAEAVKRMSSKYDFVVTSGGIGPTHDDITYSSIGKAFNAPLEYHSETIEKMNSFLSRRTDIKELTEEQKTARLRMALFPKGSEVLFVKDDLWVPVVRVNGNVCILPGVPRIFEQLLTSLVHNVLRLPPASEKPFRYLIFTKKTESVIAPFLTALSERLGDRVKVGSYPKLAHGVEVSLIGKDEALLKRLTEEVIAELDGELITGQKL